MNPTQLAFARFQRCPLRLQSSGRLTPSPLGGLSLPSRSPQVSLTELFRSRISLSRERRRPTRSIHFPGTSIQDFTFFGLVRISISNRLISLVDAAVVPELQRQPGAASAIRAGVQPGELPASVGAAEVREALVVDHAAGEAAQDRSKRGPAFQVRDFSDGRRGCAARVVRGDLGAHPAVRCTAAVRAAWLSVAIGRRT